MEHPDLTDLKVYLNTKKAVVDKALETRFPEPEGPAADVVTAMRYSLFAGGKRLRPILCLAGAEAVGGTGHAILPVACALELIHTYSLIHDDLPAMDDDDLRRGRPSCHKRFGEATAILAGDGLLTEAFYMLSAAGTETAARIPSDTLLRVIRLIARASGHKGMIGGQMVDIQSEGKSADASLVEFIHTRKTGALITAAVTSGAILGGGKDDQVQVIASYGEKIGLAFQISDDILDIEGNTGKMGKKTGADVEKGKATYPASVGLGAARKIQERLVEEAVECLVIFDGKADPLRQIARYIIERGK
ncbi:MAG: polyprenyl synthetase family protein [Deltaproteobacteria bacterium]|nr:MAG: polyprenyl synthetase family protein [Deltaproteobacteria bacterium]